MRHLHGGWGGDDKLGLDALCPANKVCVCDWGSPHVLVVCEVRGPGDNGSCSVNLVVQLPVISLYTSSKTSGGGLGDGHRVFLNSVKKQ